MDASAADLDAREQVLENELRLLGQLAKTNINARVSQTQMRGTLMMLTAQRPDARALAEAGRPELAQKLEDAIGYFEFAMNALSAAGASPLSKAEFDAQLKANKDSAIAFDAMMDKLGESPDRRAAEGRKNL
jgi:hypothetical protein